MFLHHKNNIEFTQNPLKKQIIPNYVNTELSKNSIINNKIYSLPYLTINANIENYLQYFNNGWLLTETLFSSLKYKESFYIKPYHKLRHPLIFYYGHVASFYVNKLLVSGLISQAVNQKFEEIFETGVDEMSWDVNTKENNINWPDLEEVILYRAEIYNLVLKVIRDNASLFSEEITPKSPIWALLMSFEHERIHLETSSVLIRELPLEHVDASCLFNKVKYQEKTSKKPTQGKDYPVNNLINIIGGSGKISKNDQNSYGWDNEYGSKDYVVPDFMVTQSLISNGEYFQFVQDGGYHQNQYWCQSGLDWRKYSNIYKPSFWQADGPKASNLYKLRTCFTAIDMQWDFPVLVNHYEAKAFCNYKSSKDGQNYRLLTEAEHRFLSKNETERVKESKQEVYNFNLRLSSENAVNINKTNNAEIFDLHGNIWQWLEDDFYPLDGFKFHPYYPDFSTPCYDGKHKMIAGSSFVSTGNLASIYSRYHFRPHFFQHAGFRLVTSTQTKAKSRITIELETINPQDGELYVIYRENKHLNILTKQLFKQRYPDIKI